MVSGVMNNGNQETSPAAPAVTSARASRLAAFPDELSRLKHELLQAEVRLAKARATVTGAEIDIKVLNTRLKAFAK
jgi:hypothetical protein